MQGRGRREEEENSEKAEAEAAENRKHLIRPEVRFLGCRDVQWEHRGGSPHLGTAGKRL